ncbi:hypothetical protein [Streptomyces sp. NPDC060366]|uniref:hypothetical protein n=1 Tax=Streptomyces sp. NPDC060366 TaxID=3347105 RepID=UPI00365C874D
MRNDLDGNDLFSYIMLLQTAPSPKKYIVCEGDSDCAVLDPHINDYTCETIPGYGKNSVLEAMLIAEQRNLRDIAALIDRDWEKDRLPVSSLAVKTDFYDIDATVFYSGDVCRRVVGAFCDREEVRKFIGLGSWDSPLEPVTELAFPIGILRKLNFEGGWGIRFSDTPFREVALAGARGVDIERTVLSAIERSKKPRVGISDVASIVDIATDAMAEVDDKPAYCCGHDLNGALAYLMTSKWRGRINRTSLERAMRAAFSCKELFSTTLHTALPSALNCISSEVFTCE